MKRTQRKAFTLVEMVIVIAVVAILAAVLIPTISGVIQKAHVAADQQFVASLNIQLALWEVDEGEIDSEADLAKAFKEYYDDEFYNSLAPKSGDQGYHFWFDVKDRRVVHATYDELANPANPTTGLINAGSLVQTDPENPSVNVNELTFSPASPRSLLIGQKNYFLLDRGGSPFADDITTTFGPECTVDTFRQIVDNLEKNTYNNEDLRNLVLEKLRTVAIATNNGIFALSGSTVTQIYVPNGTETISAATTVIYSKPLDLSKVESIELPEGAKVASSALVGLKTDDSDWNKPDATTIFVDTTEDKLKDLFAAESTNAVIQLPDGNRYIVQANKIIKLDENKNVTLEGTADYTDEVGTVSIDIDDGVGNKEKATYVSNKNTIYFAYDFTGDITVNVQAFKEDGTTLIANPGKITLTVVDNDSITVEDDKIKVNNANDDDTTLTVTVQGKTFTYYIKKVRITKLTVNEIGGMIPSSYEGTGNQYKSVYQLPYDTNSSFKVTYTPTYNIPNTGLDLDATLGMDYNDYVSFEDGALKVKDGVTNQRTEVKFNYGTATVTCDINLLDNSNSPFEKSTYITNSEANMGTGNVHFGTGNAKLSYLFAKRTGVKVDGQNITYSYRINDWDSATYAAEDWDDVTMNFGNYSAANPTSVTVKITVGGKDTQFAVMLVKGAFNVALKTDWYEAPDYTSIAVLDSIELEYNDTSGKGMDPKYSKNIGSNSIYGNYNLIKVPTFYVKPASPANCYFLQLSGSGTLNEVVIEGPKYGTVVSKKQSDSTSKGTFVSGVCGSGITLNNSYVSGFREPVRINNGTLNINNSTIKGGNWANIYCYKPEVVINIYNATLVQYTEDGIAACGIFVDSDTSLTINRVNNGYFNQYAYYSSDDIKKLPFMDDGADYLNNNIANYKNDIYHDTDLAHVGIVLDTKNTSCNIDQAFTNYSGKKELKVRFFLWVTVGYLHGMEHNETGCTCTNRYTSANTYDYSDFLDNIPQN